MLLIAIPIQNNNILIKPCFISPERFRKKKSNLIHLTLSAKTVRLHLNALAIQRVLAHLKKPGALFIVFISILVSFWPLSTFQSTLKWDALDISLPWRLFVNDCFQNLVLPLWNPFQHHGFPIGFIPETWYPIPTLIGFLFGYNLFSFNFEFLFHLIIASSGFYRLSRACGLKSYSSIFGALVFPLSGFFTANSQHLGWIIAAAWIPHVIYAYLEFRNKQQWKYGFEFVLYLFLLLSGGYPAYSIVICYILVGLAAAHFIKTRGSWSNFSFSISRHLQLLVIGAIIGSVLWICLFELKSELLRGSGISETEILEGSSKSIHLMSLMFPWSTVSENNTFWMADQSMISIYLGIPALCLVALSFFLLHKSFVKWSWIGTLFFLAVSLATELPVRTWLNVLPFFDLFRFSSLFRLFTEMGLILIASKSLEFVVEEAKYLKLARRIFLSAGILFLFIFLASINSFFSQLIFQSEAALNLKMSITRESLVNSLISFSLFFGCILLPNTRFITLFFTICFVDLFLTIQINGRTSVFSSEPFSELSTCISDLPKGFPLPGLWASMGSRSDRDLQTGPFYRNTNTLYKRIGWDGYIPYQFSRFDSLEKSNLYEKTLRLPPIFLSALHSDTFPNVSLISFPELNSMAENLTLENFNPNSWSLNANVNSPALSVLNQNYFEGWEAWVNGKPASVRKADKYLVSTVLQEGINLVEFHYNPGRLINGIIISGTGILLLLLWMSWRYWGGYYYIMVWILLLYIGGKWAYLNFWERSNGMNWNLPGQEPVIVNYVDQIDHHTNTTDVTATRYLNAHDLDDFYQRISNLNSHRFYFINRATCLLAEDELIEMSKLSIRKIAENRDYVCLEIEKNPALSSVVSVNSFEHPALHWSNFQEGRKYDDATHSHYQEIFPEREYSSGFEILLKELPETTQNLFIRASCKGKNLSESLLVCSIVINDETVYWNVHRVGDFIISPTEWNDVTLNADLTYFSKQDGILRVYIWNPGKETILVDKFEISSNRQITD
jgi:hypothetical protein